jgi:hypothetical protein
MCESPATPGRTRPRASSALSSLSGTDSLSTPLVTRVYLLHGIETY